MLPIIPMVNQYQMLDEKISFSNYRIIIDKKYEKDIRLFQKELLNRLEINEKENPFTFSFEKNSKLKKEEYRIQTSNQEMRILAKDGRGFFYATRTLSQYFNLFQPNKVDRITFQSILIEDKPRFSHRSFMIDVCRHFFDVQEIKKILKLMANLKFNYFHWHLSDDQGFRIDFPEFPQLKKIASCREKTKINGLQGDDYENLPYAYCYSIKEIQDIIDYAKQLHIEIIPEIDIPGHTTALVSAYPELHCLHKQVPVETNFGVFKEIICPSKENTYIFLEKFLHAFVNLFSESKYIHIGGDEVNTENWKQCPDCQKKIKELGLDDEHMLQTYFTNRVCSYLKSLGKTVISWHDGIQKETDAQIIEQYWTWEMDKKAIVYINEGRKTIYSPCSQFYFNDPYAELPLKTTYWKKVDLEGLTKEGRKNIFGVEGCIWSEWIPDAKVLETLINPRLEALAEVAWTKRKNMNFKSFLQRMKTFTSLLDSLQIAYVSEKIALAKGKKYREKIAQKFRTNDKLVEYKIYLKQQRKAKND